MTTNLISCDNCAVVLDVDKLNFVDNIKWFEEVEQVTTIFVEVKA